jgi:ADP-L-glycero-D-manno-heptose 6-epimerase
MQKIILVTGGGGFIGSNLVASLVARGTHRVVVCDEFGADDRWHNLLSSPIDEIISPSNLFYWLEMHHDALESVLHFGSIATTTEKHSGMLIEGNVALPSLLWRFCTSHGKRFFYASSYAVYGQGEHGFIDGTDLAQMAKYRPMHPQGWATLTFDRYVAAQSQHAESRPPQFAGLRFFNTYGPNEYHKGDQRSIIHKAYPNATHDRPVKLLKSSNPEMTPDKLQRDMIYVLDAVEVILWLLDNPSVSGIFNVGTGRARKYEDVAACVFGALGKTPQIKYAEMSPEMERNYQWFSQADISGLRAAGYDKPFRSLEEGVVHYIKHYLSQANPYR